MKHSSAYHYALCFVLTAFFFKQSGLAQGSGTPEFRNTNAAGSEIAYPLFSGTNRVQCIYGPNLFTTTGSSGTPAGKGRIKNIYFLLGSLYTTLPVFSDFTIRLAQNVGTRDTWSSASWNPNMTTVFHESTFTITGSSATWIKIPLEATFKYDPNLSLVFEMTVSSGVGCGNRAVFNVNKKNRIFGTYSGSSGTGFGTGLLNIGFDIEPMIPDNAGLLGLVTPKHFCAGVHDVKVDVVNNGTRPIDSVRLYYSVNGVLQAPIFYTTRIDTQGNSNGNVKTVTLFRDTFKTGVLKTLKVWTSHPNGVPDTFNTDDTLHVRLKPALSGNYKVKGSGAHYQTLSAAAADLNEFGVCGPVKFTVDTGTYQERLILDRVAGTSPVNTVTFRGVDRSKTIITNDGTSEKNWQTVLFNGMNYARFSNFTVKALDSVVAIGVHLVASSHNIIDSCDIILHKNSWSFRLTGVAGTGSTTQMMPGHAGDTNVVSNLFISGGYYGIYYAGAATWQHNYGLVFRNNVMKDYLRNGLYLMDLTNTLIDGNTIHSQRMVDVNGMTLSALNRYTCVNNKIFSTREGFFAEFSNYYYYTRGDTSRSTIANNVIITTGPGGPVGALQIFYSRRVDFHHNTVFGWSATQLWVMKDVDSCSFRNNIFKDTVIGTKIAIGASNFSSRFTIDHNVYYFPSNIARISYQGTLYSDVASWISSVTSINQNSFIQAPAFTNNQDLRLIPGNRPAGNYAGVDDDHDGIPRCRKNPTIGAFELIKGTLPDEKNPAYVCTGDTLKYPITTPSGLQNSGYGSTWTVKSVSMKTASGTVPKNFYTVNPSTAGAGYMAFIPGQDEADSAFYLQFIIEDLTGKGCYSTSGKYIVVSLKPTSGFTILSPQVCLGDSIKLTNTSTGPPNLTYTWNMGNGATVLKESFSYLYKTGGIFTVTLNAVTPGCSVPSSQTVVIGNSLGSRFVKALPYNGTIKFGTKKDPDILCAADTVTYEVMPPSGFKNMHFKTFWDVSDIKVSGKNGVLQDTFFTPPDSLRGFRVSFVPARNFDGDTLRLYLRIRSLVAGKCDSSISRYAVVGHTPQPDFAHSPGCLGAGPVFFADKSSIPLGTLAYTWDFGDGGASFIDNPSHYYADTGTYMVSLTVRSDKNCRNTKSMPVAVRMLPKVQFGYTGECTGRQNVFTDSSSVYGDIIRSWNWSFGDGARDSVRHAVHVYANPGNHAVKLVVTTSSGCKDSVTKPVRVHKTPDAAFTTVDVCENVAAMFSSNPANETGTMYKWSFGDGDSSDMANPSHTYAVNVTQTYTVKLKAKKPGTSCSSEHSATITVSPEPAISYSMVHVSKLRKRFIPSDSAGLSFKWYFGDGDSSSGISPLHTYPDTGKYVLRLSVVNQNLCKKTIADTIYVGGPQIGIGHPQNDPYIMLVPNPASQTIIISCHADYDCFIYNVTGANVYQGRLHEGDNRIDIQSFAAGLYWVKAGNETFRLLKLDQ